MPVTFEPKDNVLAQDSDDPYACAATFIQAAGRRFLAKARSRQVKSDLARKEDCLAGLQGYYEECYEPFPDCIPKEKQTELMRRLIERDVLDTSSGCPELDEAMFAKLEMRTNTLAEMTPEDRRTLLVEKVNMVEVTA